MESPTTPDAAQIVPRPQPVISRRMTGALLFAAMLTLLVLRGRAELALMREFGNDPQMAIWTVYLVSKLIYWLLFGTVVAGVLFFESRRWRVAMGVVLLVAWISGIRMESAQSELKRQVLSEGRDPATSSERLKQLLQFGEKNDGYELDNRIAAHPNATPEIKWMLYERHNVGTLMILAKSPSTPERILQEIVDRDLTLVQDDLTQKWLRKALLMNPKLPVATLRKLDENKKSGKESPIP